MELHDILNRIDTVTIPEDATVTQLMHEEDTAPYQVWRIDTHHGSYILKEAKENETALYTTLLATVKRGIPALYQAIPYNEKTYLLIEYADGENLCKCNRKKLKSALDALIAMQRETWENQSQEQWGHWYDSSLQRRRNRGNYLNDPLLEEVYESFLAVYTTLPKCLCHDDLLPFNILAGDEKAVLIDWEVGGILPYPTSFARLIAHTEEDPDALFYMSQSDRAFAIDYYYENLLKDKGISYADWQKTLAYFLFYEYCEWVYVGNRYDATDGKYFQKYLPIAKQQATEIKKLY